MPKNWWSPTALTGGGAGALDAIDGNELSDLDIAHVFVNGTLYVYQLDADSGLTESVPDRIVPDTNPGTKVWVLVKDYSVWEGVIKFGRTSLTKPTSCPTTREITGVGFRPSLVMFQGNCYRGWDDGATRWGTCRNGSTGSYAILHSTDYSIYDVEGATEYSKAYISAFGPDGFTLTFDAFLSTEYYQWKCIK
jgi:hypothetical protein